MSIDLLTSAAGAARLPQPTDAEVIQLVRDEVKKSREEVRQNRQLQNSTTTPDLQHVSGITVDLCKRNIARLPEEVVDLIKDEIERLALSHNEVSSFPKRIAECRRLRYVNLRWNELREVPRPILNVTSLEILDLSRNKIRSLPEEIRSLTTLRVLAIEQNRIERLPLCIGDMSSIRLMKLTGNPLVFPPPEIWKAADPKLKAPGAGDTEEAQLVQSIRKWLKQAAGAASNRQRLQIESDSETGDSASETQRPLQRATRSRFPVRPSIDSALSPDSIPPVLERAHNRIKSSRDHSFNTRPSRSNLLSPPEEGHWSFDSSQGEATIRSSKRHGLVTPRHAEPPKIDVFPTPNNKGYNSVAELSADPNPDTIDEAEAQRDSNRTISALLNILEAAENIVQQLIFRAQALQALLDWSEQDQALNAMLQEMQQAQFAARDLISAHEKIISDYNAHQHAEPNYRVQLAFIRLTEPLGNTFAVNQGFQRWMTNNVGWILAASASQGRNLMWLLRQLDTEIVGILSMLVELREKAPAVLMSAPLMPEHFSQEVIKPLINPVPIMQLPPLNTSLVQSQQDQAALTVKNAQITQILNAQANIPPAALDNMFERILTALQKVVDYSLDDMVKLHGMLLGEKQEMESLVAVSTTTNLATQQQDCATVTFLVQRTEKYLESIDNLRQFLGALRTGDAIANAAIRNSPEFGQAVVAPTKEFTDLGIACAAMTSPGLTGVKNGVKQIMKPLHSILRREVSAAIRKSPWAAWLDGAAAGEGVQHKKSPSGGSVPSTPLSAALGPAVQAAVPMAPPPIPIILPPGSSQSGGRGGRITFNDRFDKYQVSLQQQQQQQGGRGGGVNYGRRF